VFFCSDVPLADFSEHINELRAKATTPEAESLPIYVVCRRGNDSQEATKALLEAGHPMVRNIDGGLLTWTSQIDPNFPVY
jgi:adenylyltransferase/sulfurtransferase